MIFVTLGTQDKSFKRLLEALEKIAQKGLIKEKIIVQAGYTKFTSSYMEIFDLIPTDQFDKIIKESDLLITHGGVGAILTGLKYQKKVIAVPRLKKYREHVNDHQLQIVKNFNEEGYIIGVLELNNLEEAILNIKKFKPKKYQSNNQNMLKLMKKLIDK